MSCFAFITNLIKVKFNQKPFYFVASICYFHAFIKIDCKQYDVTKKSNLRISKKHADHSH